MTSVALLALDDCCATSLTGPIDAMQIANAHLRKQLGSENTFNWKIISPENQPITASGGITLTTQGDLSLNSWDVVFVPAMYYQGARDFEEKLASWSDIYPWIQKQWERGAVLASTCTGAFLLAEAGLLNGRNATTSWWAEKLFHRRYPDVHLNTHALLSQSDRIICSGAITAVLQLSVKMIERFTSPTIASLTAKSMLIDVGQSVQTLYVSASAFNAHSDKMVSQAQHWLQQNLMKKVSLEYLAQSMAVSQRTLIRRFKAAIGLTPQNYLQLLKVEAAKQLLETTRLRISLIAERVGYVDQGAFIKMFKSKTGLTPKAYRGRFSST